MKFKVFFFCLAFLLVAEAAAADVIPVPECKPGEKPVFGRAGDFGYSCNPCIGNFTPTEDPVTGEVVCPQGIRSAQKTVYCPATLPAGQVFNCVPCPANTHPKEYLSGAVECLPGSPLTAAGANSSSAVLLALGAMVIGVAIVIFMRIKNK